MYKRIKTKKLGRKKSHREALMRNQLKSLFTSGKVETTSPKAKVLKSETESVFGMVKRSDDEASLKRRLNRTFGDRGLVEKVLEYAPKGTVSIVKVGFRPGDNAEVSRVFLKDYSVKAKKGTKKVEDKKDEKKSGEAQKVVKKERVVNVKENTTAKGMDRRSNTRSGL